MSNISAMSSAVKGSILKGSITIPSTVTKYINADASVQFLLMGNRNQGKM